MDALVIQQPNTVRTTRDISETELYQHEVYPIIVAKLMMMGININSWRFFNFTTGNTQYCIKPFIEGHFCSKFSELDNIRLRICAEKNNLAWTITAIEIYNVKDDFIF